MSTSSAFLEDRSVLQVLGEDRAAFLQGLLSNDAETLSDGTGRYAALLSPQGKIQFDMFVIRAGGALYLDVSSRLAADLLKRLGFYKLRAKVTLSDATDQFQVAAIWGGGVGAVGGGALATYRDPRLHELGWRAIVPRDALVTANATAEDYDGMRIGLAIPDGGRDFVYGDTFPHDAGLDLLHGVDFKKGCYVGQEVVSRMQHRGTARTRVLAVEGSGPLPEGGCDLLDDGFPVGRLGSVRGVRGIALARVDRVRNALASGRAITAGGVAVLVRAPPWAPYSVKPDAEAAR